MSSIRGYFDDKRRVKLIKLLERSGAAVAKGVFSRVGTPTSEGQELMAQVVVDRLEEEWGDLRFRHRRYPRQRTFLRLLEEVGACEWDWEVLDIAGAWLDAYASLPGITWLREAENAYADKLDELLAGTGYGRRLRDIVFRDELGTTRVIEDPLGVFLVSSAGLSAVDTKLREAQAELDAGNPADAVTDTAAALQLLLEYLGHQGATLGEQLKAARKAGLFAGVDTRLGVALEALIAWVAAVRNQRSDAHPTAAPTVADARLVFRIVASLVMYLGEP